MSVVIDLATIGQVKTKESTPKRWSDGEGMCLGLQNRSGHPRDPLLHPLRAHVFLLKRRKSQLFLFSGSGFAGANDSCPFDGTDGPVAMGTPAPGTCFFTILEPPGFCPTEKAAGW